MSQHPTRPEWHLTAPWPPIGWESCPRRRDDYRRQFWEALIEHPNPGGWAMRPEVSLHLTIKAFPRDGRAVNYLGLLVESVVDVLRHHTIIKDPRQVQTITLERRAPGSPAYCVLELREIDTWPARPG